MSLWKIAWRSILQRSFASSLTTLSMALGVMLVVIVLSIHGVVRKSFQSNSTLGYNMIVGAKGGKLQLTLNTVYYLSQPIENVPYDFYLEFVSDERRADELKHSFAFQSHQASWQSAQLSSLASTVGATGLETIGQQLALDALAAADLDHLGADRPGRFAPFTQLAIPLCLGDFFGNFRVVGTTPEFFEDLVFDLENDRKYSFAQGRNFRRLDPEHGFFEAVIGATVASQTKVKLGDQISPAHGEPGGHEHERRFTVVGILDPTGTPNDRAVFVNMEGFYLMADHAKPIEQEEVEEPPGDGPAVARAQQISPEAHLHEPLPLEQREITALLVRTVNPLVTPGLQNTINEANVAQAVLPIQEIFNLFNVIVSPVQSVLLLLTMMICLVSGVSILVSIYNSMSDRKHEIAVMRALGAGRTTVMTIILFESILLSTAGGLLGWFGGHVLNAIAGPWVEARTGVSVGFFSFAPPVSVLEQLGAETSSEWVQMATRISPEWLLIPGLILLAVVVGFMPAMSAYRTDVARSLGK